MGKIILVSSDQSNPDEQDNDAVHEKLWLEETDGLADTGVYQEIAERMSAVRNGIHLDIGSGTCELAAEMVERGREGHTFGVEVNNCHIETALMRLADRKIGGHVFRARDNDTCFVDRDSPTQGRIYRRTWQDLNGRNVVVLESDIREADELLNQATNAEKVDSCSLTFFGSSSKLGHREGLSVDDDDGYHNFMRKHLNTSIKLATRATRTGGTLTRVERTPINMINMLMPEYSINKLIHRVRLSLSPYWEFLEVPTFLEADIHDVISRRAPLSPDCRYLATMLQFRRTSRPYSEELDDQLTRQSPF
jgi:hypothetical protein